MLVTDLPELQLRKIFRLKTDDPKISDILPEIAASAAYR